MSDDDVVFLDHMAFQWRMGQTFSGCLQFKRVTCCTNSWHDGCYASLQPKDCAVGFDSTATRTGTLC